MLEGDDSHDTLIADLKAAIRSSSTEVWVNKLRQVSALFPADAASLTDEQVKVFDNVLCRLTALIETKVSAELGERLAPIDNAPVETIRRLAWHEGASVAGPVLTTSRRLTATDISGIAQVRGQEHLIAICRRESLDSAVTDILLDRGGREVVQTLATNVATQHFLERWQCNQFFFASARRTARRHAFIF